LHRAQLIFRTSVAGWAKWCSNFGLRGQPDFVHYVKLMFD
jgi:hypothetical protein